MTMKSKQFNENIVFDVRVAKFYLQCVLLLCNLVSECRTHKQCAWKFFDISHLFRWPRDLPRRIPKSMIISFLRLAKSISHLSIGLDFISTHFVVLLYLGNDRRSEYIRNSSRQNQVEKSGWVWSRKVSWWGWEVMQSRLNPPIWNWEESMSRRSFCSRVHLHLFHLLDAKVLLWDPTPWEKAGPDTKRRNGLLCETVQVLDQETGISFLNRHFRHNV